MQLTAVTLLVTMNMQALAVCACGVEGALLQLILNKQLTGQLSSVANLHSSLQAALPFADEGTE